MKNIIFSFLFLCNVCYADILEIVVPVPPGGPVDAAARLVQQELQAKENINSVVIYKQGGDGQIATKYFLSNPTNKILMVSTTTTLMLKLSNKNTGYDPINDFNIIGPITTSPVVVSVKASSHLETIADFIRYTRIKKLNCGSASLYTTMYINYILQNNNAPDVVVVTYNSTPKPIVDLLSDNIDCFATGLSGIAERTDIKPLKNNLPTDKVTFNIFTALIIGSGTYHDKQIKNVLAEISPEIDFNYNKILEKKYKFIQQHNLYTK
jgi:tripartite-type tricarboxylate transporter receptor subunit TctC